MLAASYWSLLLPAVEHTRESKLWTKHGILEIVPVSVGFFLGALFVFMADVILDYIGVGSPAVGLG
jgi:zinc transporter ZupT